MPIELRVRTICELLLNYLQLQIVPILNSYLVVSVRNVLHATSANYQESADSDSIAQICFMRDVRSTTKLDSWSNVWHVYALSSVLKQPIQSVYPECNVRTRPAFNRVVEPRGTVGSSCHTQFKIMWTRLIAVPMRTWSPNHFVPCIVRHQSAQCTTQHTHTYQTQKSYSDNTHCFSRRATSHPYCLTHRSPPALSDLHSSLPSPRQLHPV